MSINRPQRCQDVEVREVEATVDEPVHWRLLSTHPVADPQAAWRIVEWYRQRWHIEQLFRNLKSQGLNLEASQVSSAEGLIKLAAMATVAAVRIMQLVLARDGALERPASDVVRPELLPLARALQRDL